MNEPEVIRYPGVYPRPKITFWWFYQTVPADLTHRFPKAWATRESLKTRDLREANALAKQRTADWEVCTSTGPVSAIPAQVTGGSSCEEGAESKNSGVTPPTRPTTEWNCNINTACDTFCQVIRMV